MLSTHTRLSPLVFVLHSCASFTGGTYTLTDGRIHRADWSPPRSIKDNEAAIVQACKEDLGKSVFETYLSEIDWCTNDIVFVTQNLQKWMKDEKAPDIPLANKLLSPKIRKDPLGAILIIGYVNAWQSIIEAQVLQHLQFPVEPMPHPTRGSNRRRMHCRLETQRERSLCCQDLTAYRGNIHRRFMLYRRSGRGSRDHCTAGREVGQDLLHWGKLRIST